MWERQTEVRTDFRKTFLGHDNRGRESMTRVLSSQLDEEDVTAVIGLTGEDGIEDLMKKGILKEEACIYYPA